MKAIEAIASQFPPPYPLSYSEAAEVCLDGWGAAGLAEQKERLATIFPRIDVDRVYAPAKPSGGGWRVYVPTIPALKKQYGIDSGSYGDSLLPLLDRLCEQMHCKREALPERPPGNAVDAPLQFQSAIEQHLRDVETVQGHDLWELDIRFGWVGYSPVGALLGAQENEQFIFGAIHCAAILLSLPGLMFRHPQLRLCSAVEECAPRADIGYCPYFEMRTGELKCTWQIASEESLYNAFIVGAF